jgi:NitT/TauT family transport system ATP-binding protein
MKIIIMIESEKITKEVVGINHLNSKVILSNVELKFDDVWVFKDFSLAVKAGKINCIVGPSGCGKTSILNLLSGLLKPYRGQLNTADERVAYIFQEDRLLPWETVYDNVRLVKEEDDEGAIMALLKALDIDGFAHKYPHQLSGGMRQRCSIARGFYFQGSLLLMDEPFKSLDYDLRLNLVGYLGELWKKDPHTIIFVTHDIDEALLLGHQVLVLSKRPTAVVETIQLHSDLKNRHVSTTEHIYARSKIIRHMSTM